MQPTKYVCSDGGDHVWNFSEYDRQRGRYEWQVCTVCGAEGDSNDNLMIIGWRRRSG